ncbi:ExbD/TolR family protein [Desulfogranum japonicum]|uniref:ExbD/TolR family protein n=1 Tax=Desulfogranum japonicum TaxID=231447 RepID=UPI00040F441B|nr:biopolymer transporter ExbD [Desulfogranum japonicum]
MDEQEFNYLNIIPLVDVMLVLLTIVLMTSTFIATGTIPVDLPGVSALEQQKRAESVTIILDAEGNHWYQDTLMSDAELVKAFHDIDTATNILVRADRNLPLQSFVSLMDMLKNIGFTKIQLHAQEL